VAYKVLLPHAALEAVREMEQTEQQQVARSLRTELWCQERGFEPPFTVRVRHPSLDPTYEYFAASLSSGHVAVFRCLTAKELRDGRLPRGRIVFQLQSATPISDPEELRSGLWRTTAGN
jgi:hypothetical protein